MIKIIGARDTGKTKKLLTKAALQNAIVVCANPKAMLIKAADYDIHGLEFMSYEEFRNVDVVYTEKSVLIDDVDHFLNFINPRIIGFSVSNED